MNSKELSKEDYRYYLTGKILCLGDDLGMNDDVEHFLRSWEPVSIMEQYAERLERKKRLIENPDREMIA